MVLVIPILCTPGFHTTANATRAASPACQKSCCLSCCWGSALTGSLLSFLHPHLSGWKVKDGKCRLSRQSTALGASKPETSRTLCHSTAESRTTILILTYKRKRQPAWFRFWKPSPAAAATSCPAVPDRYKTAAPDFSHRGKSWRWPLDLWTLPPAKSVWHLNVPASLSLLSFLCERSYVCSSGRKHVLFTEQSCLRQGEAEPVAGGLGLPS